MGRNVEVTLTLTCTHVRTHTHTGINPRKMEGNYKEV